MGTLLWPRLDGPISSSSAAKVSVKGAWTWISWVMSRVRLSVADAVVAMIIASCDVF
jgi:hypothetical protein